MYVVKPTKENHKTRRKKIETTTVLIPYFIVQTTYFCALEDCLMFVTLLLLTEMTFDGSSDTSVMSVVVDSILDNVGGFASDTSLLGSKL